MPDTLFGRFLFISGDTAYVRCEHRPAPDDSVATPYFGRVLAAFPPIWKFRVANLIAGPAEGQSIAIEVFHLPRRAADLVLACGDDYWDPLAIRGASSWAIAPLFHRAALEWGGPDDLRGDLARAWYWRGNDLFLVIDTTARFGDGLPVDAFAVKYTLERYLWYAREAPAFSWQYAIAGLENYRRGLVGHVVGLIPRSADTLQINLRRPHYELPARLAASKLAVVRWDVTGAAAPVTTTAGHYSQVLGSTVFGAPPQGGSLEIVPREGIARCEFTERPGAERVRDSAFDTRLVRVPGLLVIRACGARDISLLTFLKYALDRRALAEIAFGGPALVPDGVFPSPGGYRPGDSGSSEDWMLDLKEARYARRLLRGVPRLAVGYAEGWRKASEYLVDAMKAWDIRATLAEPGATCDVRVEFCDFGAFDADALAETALTLSGAGEEDSLVGKLQIARSLSDDVARGGAYRSLLARIAESPSYVALLQPLAVITTRVAAGLEHDVDALGRPRGPVFERRPRP